MFKVLGVYLHPFVTSYKTVYGIKRNTNNKYMNECNDVKRQSMTSSKIWNKRQLFHGTWEHIH